MKLRNYIVILGLLLGWHSAFAQDNHFLTVKVRVSEKVQQQFLPQGRLFIFLGTNPRAEPRKQLWPAGGNHIFAKNLSNWPAGERLTVDAASGFASTGKIALDAVPEGTYYVQALWDQDTQESRIDAPGNLFSAVEKVIMNDDLSVELLIDKEIPPHQLAENRFVKLVEIRSDTLSEWWGKPMFLKASVLLPSGYFDNPQARYPVRYNVAGYGGRYTRVNRLVSGGNDFANWWFTDQSPQFINVFLDGEGPFGDSYQLDSENSGPYGYALIHELIPHIEKTYRGIGSAPARFVDGCSTGGWVSLALQVYYPDFFNGVWSYSPDAVEFENYQLINIYKDENAYVNEWGNLRPVARDITGDPVVTLKDFIQYENVLGASDTYLNSGGQFSAHTALYSPRGENGLPAPLFDPVTGKIDHSVAEHWKKYDMKIHLKENWTEVGPKLQGKIWVWMGDMDNFFLNPATRALDEFLKTTVNPKSDAIIKFDPMQGHCQQFNHRKILEMMDARFRK